MQFLSTPRGLRRPAAMIGALSLALALAACNGPAPEEQEQALDQAAQAAQAAASTAEATPPPPASCDASQVQGLVGQTYSDAVQAQAKEDSGASDVRVLKPNQPVTMEFIGERLNIEIDDKNVISGVRCG
jgi:hypothetical protein